MARPSDTEFKLRRQIKDLESRNKQLELELSQLRKKLEKEVPVKKKAAVNDCPDCGSVIKSSELPFGTLHICGASCGYREVKRGKV